MIILRMLDYCRSHTKDSFIGFHVGLAGRDLLTRWLEVNCEENWRMVEHYSASGDAVHSSKVTVFFESIIDFDIAFLRYR